MKYQVIIADSALDNAMETYAFIRADSPANAESWFDGLLFAIDTLEHYPRRCRVAPEAEDFGEEIRHLLYGSYRILFTIRHREVHVFHIRHGAQSPLRPGDSAPPL